MFDAYNLGYQRLWRPDMLDEKTVAAINEWLAKGFEIEIYRKPDGTLNIKTVRKKRLVVE